MTVTVAILAGGKSRRMGRNKSFVLFDGQPMIERVLAAARQVSDDVILIVNEPEPYAYLGLPMYGDRYPEHGPLAGIFTAVFHAKQAHVLVVATDMPWLNVPLLRYMVSIRERGDLIVPRWEKYPEPLHAIYSKRCLGAMERNLQAGRLKITGFFGEVAPYFVPREVIAKYDEAGRSFANINRPTDLKKGDG